jgi:hypothetical protein
MTRNLSKRYNGTMTSESRQVATVTLTLANHVYSHVIIYDIIADETRSGEIKRFRESSLTGTVLAFATAAIVSAFHCSTLPS